MVVYEHPVRFEEIDAAGIAFFARFVTWAHEAMEDFFSAVEGGYVGLIVTRRVGFPAVHLDVDFKKPLRYGDVVRIETSVVRVGKKSAVFRYRMHDKKSGALAAEVLHTVVTTDLGTLASCPMPDDVRARLAAHLEG